MNFSDIIGIAALIVGLLGIPITFIVARRTRQRPDLRYAIDFDVILNPSDRLFDQGLYMTLKGDKIDCISRTRIALWNQRGDTIRRSDILDTDPLRLQFEKDDKALQSRVITMSRKQIALSAIEPVNESAVLIDFDFLDAKDGGVLEVIHQGTIKPAVLGTLRGSTIRGNGSTSLNPDALKRIGQKSALRRWLDNKFLAKLNAVTILVAALIVVTVSAVVFYSSTGGSDRLIDPRHYHLYTKKGQIAFDNAVTSTGYYSGAEYRLFWAVIAITTLFMVVWAIYTQYNMVKRKIPGGITVYWPSTDNPLRGESLPDPSKSQ